MYRHKLNPSRGALPHNSRGLCAALLMAWLKHLRGVWVTAIFSVTIILVTVPIVLLALIKLLLPVAAWRRALNPLLDAIADSWIRINNWQQSVFLPTQLRIEGEVQLSRREWYMLVANHQSWVDILVLVRVFGVTIPGVKFFFKRSLLWVPVLGLALWGLDFPSMRRYSRERIAREPSLKDKDRERARKACERFRYHPVTVINFLEGTRFTPLKHDQQQSPYGHLLLPKAGGLAATLSAMNGQLHQLLDVSVRYPSPIPSYWDYACGQVPEIRVHRRLLPLGPEQIGDYDKDEAFRQRFQAWVNQLWQEKDERLQAMPQAKL